MRQTKLHLRKSQALPPISVALFGLILLVGLLVLADPVTATMKGTPTGWVPPAYSEPASVITATVITATPTPSPTPPPCGLAWRVVNSPNTGIITELQKAAVVAPNDVWATGFYQPAPNQLQTLAEHWDGQHWDIVQTPPVTESKGLDIHGLTANDIWIVGASNSNTQTLTLHWDGTSWIHIPSPSIPSDFEGLRGVAMLAPDSVWAAGFYDNSGSLNRTVIERWDGSQWSIVPSPDPYQGDNGFADISAVSANDIWAVGGASVNSAGRTFTEHWDGTQWSFVPSPSPGTANSSLSAVNAVSTNDVWSVGWYNNANSADPAKTLVEHWDGSTWSVVPSPNVDPTSPEYLQDVSAVAANDVWTVGYRYYDNGNAFDTVVEHWDGSQWSIVPSPNRDAINILSGVEAVNANDVWAVGTYALPIIGTYSLIERWNDPCVDGTVTPTTVPSATSTASSTPTGTPTACAISFEDVPVGSTFYPYIQCMACQGIINGYPCGGPGEPCDPNNNPYFRPGNNVTRGQFSKIASNAAGFNDTPGAQQYEDVLPGSTFYDFIWRLSDRGLVNGYPCGGAGEPCGPNNLPYFRPNANISRGQIAKIDSNAAGYNDTPGAQQYEDVLPGSTFYDFIWRLSDRGLVNGYPCGGAGEPCGPNNLPYFRPGANATRGQASKVVSNTFFPNCPF